MMVLIFNRADLLLGLATLDLRHALATLATLDLRHALATLATLDLKTCELLISCASAWPKPSDSLNPSTKIRLDGRRIRGNCNVDTFRISRWSPFKAAALAG
jgi:hypothetical protein